MKHKELTGFLVIAIILVLFALFFFLYSQFIGHMASFRIHYELQQIHDSNNSGESLTLSKEKVMELIEFASQDEKRWRRTTTYSIKNVVLYGHFITFAGKCSNRLVFIPLQAEHRCTF
jgi:hypothetical protein